MQSESQVDTKTNKTSKDLTLQYIAKKNLRNPKRRWLSTYSFCFSQDKFYNN